MQNVETTPTTANAIDEEPRDAKAVARRIPAKPVALTFLLVFTCFTLTSSCYLAWLYHLMAFSPPISVDALTMGAGYVCQALGIGLTAACMRTWPEIAGRVPLVVIIALNFTCAAPAALGDALATTLVAGYLMSVLSGIISAFYLMALSSIVPAKRRGIVFGGGYACSIVASWLVSMAQEAAIGADVQLAACAVFSVLAVAVAALDPFGERNGKAGEREQDPVADAPAHERAHLMSLPTTLRGWWIVLALAGATVVLMSMVKNMGFNFPSSDIGDAISVETSRLFYAMGLVIAGIVIDRNRKHGALLCMAALVVPFALMAISGEPVSSAVLWAIDYFFYGFFSVFRVVLFTDMASQANRPHLSGLGLLFGRVGDALGTIVCISLVGSSVALVAVAAVLFVACVFSFWRLFQQLYMTHEPRQRSEREVFDEFAAHHDLSPREREVLRLVLDNRTNAEAATELFVSESTVKFHVRNLLRKTGCRNRNELLALYVKSRRADS